MKIRVSGIRAEVLESTKEEYTVLKSLLTFQTPVMRIPYQRGVGRRISWETVPKCFLFGNFFASPFRKLIRIPFEEVNDTIKQVTPKLPQLPFQLKKIQEKAFLKLLKLESAMVVGPTSIGKTYLIGATLAAFRDYRVLVTVHNKGLAAQNYEKISSWFPELKPGRIYGGIKDFNSQICVGTFQSLRKRPFKADVVLVDECVHTLAPTYLQSLIQTEAKRWYGFTATPKGRADKLDNQLADLFQHKVVIATMKEGMKEKLLCPVEFYCIKYNNPKYKFAEWSERDVNYVYQKLIALDKERNELIRMLAEFELKRTGKVVLVLVHRMNHLHVLKKLLPDALIVSYKSKLKEREKIRKLKKGIIIATRVIEEGVDNHEIYSVINTACVRSRIAIIQRLGRGLRFEEGKKLFFYDILDQSPQVVEKQGHDRSNMYRNFGRVYSLDPT